jgi:hypothetical protein
MPIRERVKRRPRSSRAAAREETMSYPSAPPRVYQIDVVDQVGRAYRAVFDRTQLVGEMALLPFLIVLALTVGARLLFGPATVMAAMMGPAGILMVGSLIISALLNPIAVMVVFSVFIVRWHRFVLLGESVSAGPIPPGWTDFVIAGVKLGVIVFVGWLVLMLLAVLPPHFLTVPLAGIGGIALTLAALRASLIFPAAAIEQPLTLQAAWGWVEGNFWRLFIAAFACYLPFVILQMLINAVASIFPSIIWIVFEALRIATSFIGAAVVAALLSHIYRDLVEVGPA